MFSFRLFSLPLITLLACSTILACNNNDNPKKTIITLKPDTLAPTFAGVTTAEVLGQTTVRLYWQQATDNTTLVPGIDYLLFASTGNGPIDYTLPRLILKGIGTGVVTDLQPDTLYSFAVRARDLSGNIDGNTAVTAATTLALPVAPQAVYVKNFSAPAITSATEVTATFELSESDATALCQLADQPKAPCTTTTTWHITGLNEGFQQLLVYPVDANGTEWQPWVGGVQIDRTAPSVMITNTPKIISTQFNLGFTFESNEQTATFECSWDSEPYQACDSIESKGEIGPGFHIFQVRAVDSVGNRSLPQEYTWTVFDCKKPGGFCTFAGIDISDLQRDYGQSSRAALSVIGGLAQDDKGNIYASDFLKRKIWKFKPDNTFELFAGTGGSFMNPVPTNVIATETAIAPHGMVVRDNQLLFADGYYGCIRAIDLDTNILTTFAGACTGQSFTDGDISQARFKDTQTIILDASNNVYVADLGNHRIRYIHDNIVETIAGNGTAAFSGDNGDATLASLNSPSGVAISFDNKLYIADFYNDRVRMVDLSDNQKPISTVIGGGLESEGPGTSIFISHPRHLAVDSTGGLWVSSYGQHAIGYLDSTGYFQWKIPGVSIENNDFTAIEENFLTYPQILWGANSGDFGPVEKASISVQHDLLLMNDNQLLFPSANSLRYISDGYVFPFAGPSNDKQPPTLGQPAAQTSLLKPYGITRTTDGTILIGDRATDSIYTINNKGQINLLASGITAVQYLAFDQAKNLVYASSREMNQIIAVNLTNGQKTVVAGTGIAGYSGDSGPAINARLNAPDGLRLFDNQLFVSDQGNHCIRMINLNTNIINTYAGECGQSGGVNNPSENFFDAHFNTPGALAVDTFGNLAVVDTGNYRIRYLNKNTQQVSTLVGSGVAGNVSEGALPLNDSIQNVYSLAFAGSRLIFGDRTNLWSIKLFDNQATIHSIAGSGGSGVALWHGYGEATAAGFGYVKDIYINGDELLFTAEHTGRVFYVRLE